MKIASCNFVRNLMQISKTVFVFLLALIVFDFHSFENLKNYKIAPAKTNSCNPFHNRTQDRTKERENCRVLNLGISKRSKVNSQSSTGWSPHRILCSKMSTHWVTIKTVNFEEDTQRCHLASVPKITADTSTA